MAAEHDVAANLNPAATDHIPPYVTLPGQSDWLLSGTAIFLIIAIIGVGVLYLKLHTLPDRMAHAGQKIQFEIVAILCLIALFTHNHAFWIAALLLAVTPLPDFKTPITSITGSLQSIAQAQTTLAASVGGTAFATTPPQAATPEADAPAETALAAETDTSTEQDKG